MDTPRPMIPWINDNKLICWLAFWVGWFALSPTTIIPGAVAILVGLVIYKERALNLVTISAAWLGILMYLALGHNLEWFPENVRLWMGVAAIFSLIVLGKRFPMFGWFLLFVIVNLMRGGRRRRW
jgi:hypothetical protein